MGQMSVRPNWNRFAPTKAVKASHHFETKSGLSGKPSASDRKLYD